MLPYVPGEGDGSRLIIIGEAPGREEKSEGAPFVGRSGRILRGILAGLGSPEGVRITNVVKCRPPDNRVPRRAEIDQCLPHLIEELEAAPDATLLLLGATALHTLTDVKTGITRARGEWYHSNDGRISLATYHPGYIARSSGSSYFDDLVLDVTRALEGPPQLEFTTHEVLSEPHEVAVYFGLLGEEATDRGDSIVIAWDLETSGYRAYQDYILAMSLSHVPGQAWVITEEMMHNEEVHDCLRRAFSDPRFLWVGHNAKFDQIFCLQHLGSYPKLHADTMMMHLAVDERRGTHDLKLLCRDWLGAPDWEGELWKYLDNREDTYAKVPRDVLYKYAGYDADFTLRIFNLLSPQMEEEEVWALHDELLVPASETMMLAEFGGVTIDLDEVNAWQERLEDEIDLDIQSLSGLTRGTTLTAINDKLTKLGLSVTDFWNIPITSAGFRWDKSSNRYTLKDNVRENVLARFIRGLKAAPQGEIELGTFTELERILAWRAKLVEDEFSAGSWMKVGTLVYDVLELTYLSGRDVRTRGQSYSTSSASLEPYAREHEVVNSILALRTKKKLYTTYVMGLEPDEDARVHPRWKMHATVTGRIGCTDPNVMNQPHEAGTRDFFIASPDHMLVQADYSQAELRLLAAYSANHEVQLLATEHGWHPEKIRAVAEQFFLVDCYRSGRDLHTEVTLALFGENWGYDERMIAKAYNFGLVYGRSAKSIADAFDIPVEEAERQQQAFFARMPEVERFLQHLEHQVVDPGYLVNCFGRRRRFSYVDDWNIADHQRQARNFMMQSTASDCCLTATVRMSEWFRELDWGRVLIFLHDSVVVEVPECAVEITARKLYETLLAVPRERLGDLVPFKVDVGIGFSWGQLKSYDVETGRVYL
jgi:uracil-DNA glycosylase family 4